MKKLVYIFLAVSFSVLACTDMPGKLEEPDGDGTSLNVSLHIPEYTEMQSRSVSYENAINDVWLFAFDAKGLFLARVHATDLVVEETGGIGTGSFKVKVPFGTKIIHFIANCDEIASYDDRAALQKDERELIPALYGNRMVFWGRGELANGSNVDVVLYRNQAKVTVENEATNFDVTGYALCNYATVGTTAPFNPSETSSPFVILENTPTIPLVEGQKVDQTAENCDLSSKYMSENLNLFNNQCYVIVKGKLTGGTSEKYYKIQLLDGDKKPYSIVRNYHYRVVIKSFSEQANGSTSFDDAKEAEPSNNIYAEIFKDSPTISDNQKNTLTVGQLNLLFIQGGTLSVSAHYTKNDVAADGEINVSVIEDPNNILTNLSYDSSTGLISANVAKVVSGQNTATISVKAGVLSRIMTITSTSLYSFLPASTSPELYTERDQDVMLKFTIPSSIPKYLFPVKCVISTNNLYPVAPNKNMEILFEDGTYKYVYWAEEPGEKSLNFKTSNEDNDETITIENDYFHTANVKLQSRYFSNVSINGNNIVNYGPNSTAVFHFMIPDFPDFPPTYPLKVHISTQNLTTSDAGWTKVSDGYERVYASAPQGEQTVQFLSSQPISSEQVVISAPGFRSTTIYYDNQLAEGVWASGYVRVMDVYTVARFQVTTSDQSIVPDFTASNTSTYTFMIQPGVKISDVVTFYIRSGRSQYSGSYTVKQLLQQVVLNLK